MSNMSYCRFENTASDLDDCADALEELLNTGIGRLSRSELAAAKRLAVMCTNVVQLFVDYGDADLEEVMEDEEVSARILDEANADAEEEA